MVEKIHKTHITFLYITLTFLEQEDVDLPGMVPQMVQFSRVSRVVSELM